MNNNMNINMIDINKNFKHLKETVQIENELVQNDNYMNNYDYKISLVNIDSRYRVKVPENIVNMDNTILLNNPLTVTANSTLVQLYIPNHNYIIMVKYL